LKERSKNHTKVCGQYFSYTLLLIIKNARKKLCVLGRAEHDEGLAIHSAEELAP
jgi:hypothetical protein